MSKPRHKVSLSLLAAQQRLQILRNKRRAERVSEELPVSFYQHGRFPQQAVSHPYSIIRDQLPDHLGWGSTAVTAVLRASQENHKEPGFRPLSPTPSSDPPTVTEKKGNNVHPKATIKLYPDLALGMLQKEQTIAGRIWLLLHYIDKEGRGWISLEETREKLTRQESGLRVCGWRQLRNLLNQGEMIFWERRNGRIWLRSVAKVAAALDVPRLTLHPVALPVSTLLKGIGLVRAHFYASFHSSRANRNQDAHPIARDTLTRISHILQRTQRIYEKRAGVQTKSNYAIGPKANAQTEQGLAWTHGHSLFHLKDGEGRHGRKNNSYLAWQLPNNYAGPHAKQPRGRMKRINQELADLFMKGMTGNGEKKVEGQSIPRRFFGNGRLAAKAYNRSSHHDIYWKRGETNGRYQLWYVFQGKN